MKYLKLFEDFKENNLEGTLITEDDIINCIKSNGVIYVKSIKGLKDIDKKDLEYKKDKDLGFMVKPISVDKETVTVSLDNNTFEINLTDIKRVEY